MPIFPTRALRALRAVIIRCDFRWRLAMRGGNSNIEGEI